MTQWHIMKTVRKNHPDALCEYTSLRAAPFKSCLSADVKPVSQTVPKVARVQMTIKGGLKGSMASLLQKGSSNIDGITHSNGRKTPSTIKRRRGMKAVERVSFILTKKCTPTPTKAPTKVPTATPTAPIFCTK